MVRKVCTFLSTALLSPLELSSFLPCRYVRRSGRVFFSLWCLSILGDNFPSGGFIFWLLANNSFKNKPHGQFIDAQLYLWLCHMSLSHPRTEQNFGNLPPASLHQTRYTRAATIHFNIKAIKKLPNLQIWIFFKEINTLNWKVIKYKVHLSFWVYVTLEQTVTLSLEICHHRNKTTLSAPSVRQRIHHLLLRLTLQRAGFCRYTRR
jgi:hypothetical protein